MYHRIIRAAVVSAAMLMVAPLAAQSINGTWQVANGTMYGKAVPANVLSSMSLNITNDRFVAKSGSLNSTGTLIANAQSNPAQLDLSITGGSDNGRKLKAIYRLENGALTITFSENAQYPTTFNSTADNKYLTLVYRQGSGANDTATTGAINDEGSGAGSSFK